MPGKADEGDDNGKGADERGKKEREFLFLVVFCCLKMIQESLDHPHPHPPKNLKRKCISKSYPDPTYKIFSEPHERGKK